MGYKRAGMRHWYYTVPIPLRAYVAKAPRQGNLFFISHGNRNGEQKSADLFIPLDIFRKITENGCIKNEVEAWLTFLSTDEPARITSLITEYPKFKPMYEDIYRLCRNTEEVMKMFSEELAILDKNTVEYMIDEMQEELDRRASELAEKDSVIAEKDSKLAESAKALQQQEEEIKKLREELERLKSMIQ